MLEVSDVKILVHTAASFSRHRCDVIHPCLLEKQKMYPVRWSDFSLCMEQVQSDPQMLFEWKFPRNALCQMGREVWQSEKVQLVLTGNILKHQQLCIKPLSVSNYAGNLYGCCRLNLTVECSSCQGWFYMFPVPRKQAGMCALYPYQLGFCAQHRKSVLRMKNS